MFFISVPKNTISVPRKHYILGVDIWIINSENKIFIQKRSPNKTNQPNVWAMTGGSVIRGEGSLQSLEREVLEELGIKLELDDVKLLKVVRTGVEWVNIYIVRQDFDLEGVRLQESEVTECKWVTYSEIEKLFEEGIFIKNRWEFIREELKVLMEEK